MTGTIALELVEHALSLPFGDVRTRLRTAINSAGMMVFAEIDHTAAAIESGLTLPDTCVLIYGNPKVGTPIMQATPNTALDLPLHVLIRAVSKTETIFAYRPIGPLLQIDGAEADAAARLASAQVTLFKRFLSLQDQ